MALRGLGWLVLLQLLGTVLSMTLLPMLPAPILGMLLLLGCLLLRGKVDESLGQASGTLLQYLPLLLVPATVSIMDSDQALFAELPLIVLVLALSLLITVPFCGWLMQYLMRRQERKAAGRKA